VDLKWGWEKFVCFKIKEGDLILSWFSQLPQDIKTRGKMWQGCGEIEGTGDLLTYFY
jgi:hypothetical protein